MIELENHSLVLLCVSLPIIEDVQMEKTATIIILLSENILPGICLAWTPKVLSS